ncbi:hypothetical protein [Thalassobaculum sp.]|uniref:hypothetical protein n=1 Tax=Thalassobaculum sp. TaxID=2022740 RepID=UPI0032EFA0B9
MADANRSAQSLRWRVGLLVALSLTVFIGANAHLLYVAFTASPECVEHLKEASSAPSGGMYRAAKPSC